jgi:hypothetical protein
VVRRERTNTPLQALAALNDEQLIEAARRLAEQCLANAAGGEAAIFREIYERLLCRRPTDAELRVLEGSLRELRTWYAGHADDAAQVIAVGETQPSAEFAAAELASWTMLCNQLLNLDEVLNK